MADISAMRNWVLRHFTADAVVMFDNNISTPEAGARLYRRHQCRLVPLGSGFTTGSRYRLVYDNFFNLAHSLGSETGRDPLATGRVYHAVLLNIDHCQEAPPAGSPMAAIANPNPNPRQPLVRRCHSTNPGPATPKTLHHQQLNQIP